MSNNKNIKSAYPTMNNISGTGNKGLMNQRRTYEEAQDDRESEAIGEENMLLDRYLATSVGSPESRVAKAAFEACRNKKSGAKDAD